MKAEMSRVSCDLVVFDEGENVCVDHVSMGGHHAVGKAGVDFQRAVLDQFGLSSACFSEAILYGMSWSSSPCITSVGTVIASRSSVWSVAEYALISSYWARAPHHPLTPELQDNSL